MNLGGGIDEIPQSDFRNGALRGYPDQVNSPQLGTLMSLGSSLTQARKAAGMSLDELAERTCVRASILREFENDDFSKSGGETYARGHIRNLSHALGVDAATFLDMYEVEHAASKAPLYDLLVENNVTLRRSEKNRMSIKSMGIISASIVAVAVIGQVAYSNLQSSPKSVLTSPAPSAKPVASAAAPKTPDSAAALEVSINAARGSSWVFATNATGEVLFTGSLAQGERKTISSADTVNIRLGNAGAVDISVNGKAVASLGAVGEVVDRTFEANSSK